MNQISLNLRNLRIFDNPRLHYKALSQKDLSNILGYNQTLISRIENGLIPNVVVVLSYSVYFGVSIDDICFGKYEYRDGVLDFYESPPR